VAGEDTHETHTHDTINTHTTSTGDTTYVIIAHQGIHATQCGQVTIALVNIDHDLVDHELLRCIECVAAGWVRQWCAGQPQSAHVHVIIVIVVVVVIHNHHFQVRVRVSEVGVIAAAIIVQNVVHCRA